jgi:glycosyltransferase involved in cell wall biosynthesis
MRILHLLPRGVIGGAEKLTLSLANRQKARHQVSIVFLFSGGAILEEALSMGLDASLLDLGRASSFRGFIKAVIFLKRWKPDIVHVHLAPYALLIAAFLGQRVLVVYHEHGTTRDVERRKGLMKLLLCKLIALIPNAYIAVSSATKADMVRVYGIPADRIRVIYNGIELADWGVSPRKEGNESLRGELGLSTPTVLIGIVARLVIYKGIDRFLQVAARIAPDLPSARFVIVGDGPCRRDLELLSAQLKLKDRVFFLGSRTDVNHILEDIDLFLVTSYSEPFGIVAIEAMSKGVPVVGFAVGGVPEVIDTASGILVPPGDIELMARESVELLNDKERMKSFSDSAVKRAKKFDIREIAREVEQLYEGFDRR